MISHYQIIILTCVLSCSCTAAEWPHIKLRFDSWYDIPYSVSEITTSTEQGFGKYVKAAHDSKLNVDLYSYPDDPRVLLMFDSYGNIGGLRVCYLKNDVAKLTTAKNVSFPFNYTALVGEFYTEEVYWGVEAWCNDVLVTSPYRLIQGGRDKTEGHPAQELWLRLHGSWVKIPEDESPDVEALGFVKQGCYDGMGQHYFFEMTPEKTCEKLVPTTLLYHEGKLVGCNLPSFGVFTKTEDRVWFESFSREAVARMSPYAHSCVLDWIFTYGSISCHVSLLANHSEVTCPT